MANEVKIDQEQFEQLVDWLEGVAGRPDEVGEPPITHQRELDDLISAVKAVEAAVEALPQG
jgi:hypothetical protein